MLAALLCFRLDDIDEVAKEMESVIAQGQKFVDEGYKVCEIGRAHV